MFDEITSLELNTTSNLLSTFYNHVTLILSLKDISKGLKKENVFKLFFV